MSQWPSRPIALLGAVSTGSTPKTSDESYYGGDIPFVTPAELDSNAPVISASRTLSAAGSQEARLLPEGAVMVCCIGSLGKVGIAGCTVATNQQINSVVFNPTLIFSRFGFYACRRLKSTLETMAPATTIAIVNKSKFEQLEIPVPPLIEQRRIADVLDQAEALRAKRRAALAQLDNLTQSIFLDLFGNPATNPKDWTYKSLFDLGKIVTGGTPPSAKSGMFDGPIPFVTPGDLESDEPVKRSLTMGGSEESRTVRAGATLVCCIGTIGKMGIVRVRSAFNQQINAIEWNGEVDDHYGYAVLQFFRPTIKSWGASTTVPILKKSSFEKIEIPVPPLSLQREFARRFQMVERLQGAHKASLAELDDLFASLQHRAFQGEL